MARQLQRELRVNTYLKGVGLQMRAAFQRSGAHKLPAKMGELREDALASFLNEWLPRRFSAITNAIPVHLGNHNLNRELDMVSLDQQEAFRLPLDAGGAVSLVAWRDIRLHIEVKSTLTQDTWEAAMDAARACTLFGQSTACEAPPCILFAYSIDARFRKSDAWQSLVYDASSLPFAVVAVIGEGARYHPDYSSFALQVEYGLSSEMASVDLKIANAEIQQGLEIGAYRSYVRVGGRADEDVLFGLMAFAAHHVPPRIEETDLAARRRTARRLSDELIMAARRQAHDPLFVEAAEQAGPSPADVETAAPQLRELRVMLAGLRRQHPGDWARRLCHSLDLPAYPLDEITYGPQIPDALRGKYQCFSVDGSFGGFLMAQLEDIPPSDSEEAAYAATAAALVGWLARSKA